MFEELRAKILEDTGVDALVNGRMWAEILPQGGTLPAITYQAISEYRRPTMTTTDGLPRTRVQIDCWAVTSAEAHAVANAVRLAIDGFSGVMGVGSPPGVEAIIFAASRFSTFEQDAKVYRVSRDYLIWAREP